MSKYDDASWHYGGEYPQGLPNTNAATHIGFFLAWCIENDFISEELKEDTEENLEAVKERTMTGAEFLIANCDEKFSTYDLNEDGNSFAMDYYGLGEETAFAKKYGSYLQDCEDVLSELTPEKNLYYIEDAWENYDIMKVVINRRYREWKNYKGI